LSNADSFRHTPFTYDEITSELRRIIEVDFTVKQFENTSISRSLRFIQQSIARGNHIEGTYELMKLSLLVANLQDIEGYSTKMLGKFKKSLTQNLSFDDHFGSRFEILTASSLARGKVNFEKLPEKVSLPDFVIHEDEDIFIECSTVHLAKPKPKHTVEKIRQDIKEKANKSYCNNRTALFIDATGIFSNSLKHGIHVDDLMRSEIEGRIKETTFGSILVFRYAVERKENRFKHAVTIRIDNSTIKETLLSFLDKHFPRDFYKVYDYLQPDYG
jgi:hypothetical protein